MTIIGRRSIEMARTKLSVTKALTQKKVNLNESDVNENNITA